MASFRVPIFGLTVLAAAILLGGCIHHKKQPPQATGGPTPQVTWSTEPLAMPAQKPLPVTEGPAPLVYLVEVAATVRVMDTTANQEFLKINVPGRTLVAVHELAGIRIGGATIKMGPLPAGHRFAIFLESKEPNVMRRGTIRPGQPQPTTRHGGAP